MSLASRPDYSVGWLATGRGTDPPTISAGAFSVADTEAIGYDVGTPTFTGTGVTFAITAGNAAGKFTINASTGLIELAAAVNYWNLWFLTGANTYALTVQATNAGGSASATITITVTNADQSSRILQMMLIETTGTAMVDTSGVAGNGVYSGVAFIAGANPGGQSAPLGDGVNDKGAFHSAALNTAFNGQLFTISLWGKAFDSNFWSAGGAKAFMRIGVDASNFLLIYRSAVNQLTVNYTAGGIEKERNITISTLNWFDLSVTIDKAGDAMKVYLDGVQQGATIATLGTWTGTLDANACNLFANTVASLLPGNVYESAFRILNKAVLQAGITKLQGEFDA